MNGNRRILIVYNNPFLHRSIIACRNGNSVSPSFYIRNHKRTFFVCKQCCIAIQKMNGCIFNRLLPDIYNPSRNVFCLCKRMQLKIKTKNAVKTNPRSINLQLVRLQCYRERERKLQQSVRFLLLVKNTNNGGKPKVFALFFPLFKKNLSSTSFTLYFYTNIAPVV